MSAEFPRSSELDERVAALFAEIQDAGLRALEGRESPRGEAPGMEPLEAETLDTESFEGEAFTSSRGVGVCRIIIDGVPSGCYPGVTKGACRRIASQIDGARAEWDEQGSC